MSSYVNNVVVAALLFPLIAAALSLPYAIYQYRRFGSISVWKTFLVFSLIFYLICAYFMVILPLPADRTAFYATAAHPQLNPFYALDIMAPALARLDVTSPASWLAFLKNPTVYTTLFNVLLTLPFGVGTVPSIQASPPSEGRMANSSYPGLTGLTPRKYRPSRYMGLAPQA